MIVMAIPVTQACVIQAARVQQVPLQALTGTMAVEHGRVGEVSARNRNGSYDIGPMQINTYWLSSLSRFHVTVQSLTYNGCLNVMVGAWVLRNYWNELGGKPDQIWEAIGHYHSHTRSRAVNYEWKVYERLSAHVTLNGVIDYANQWFHAEDALAYGAGRANQPVADRLREHAADAD